MSASAVSEAIERDLAAAEADTEADTAAEAPEPEPEPEQAPPPMGAKELAAIGKKIDAENERHEKRLRELYGDAFEEMRDCPLCLSEGFVPPLTADALPPEQIAAVREAIGENEQPEYKMLEGVEECPKCGGWGVVQTPSKNDLNRVKNCLSCDSRGYREVINPAPAYPAPTLAPFAGNGAGTLPPVPGELDAWSRPAGHPHYGIAPALVT